MSLPPRHLVEQLFKMVLGSRWTLFPTEHECNVYYLASNLPSIGLEKVSAVSTNPCQEGEEILGCG